MKNRLGKNYFFISLLLLLFSFQVRGEHFNCDLSLDLIENTASTQTIRMVFDVELGADSKNIMTGTMITCSCFNTIPEPFNSNFLEFKQATINDLMQGNFCAQNLSIGNYTVHHYQLNLNFIQIENAPEDGSIIRFEAAGKILPLDNPYFIHQNITGECWLK